MAATLDIIAEQPGVEAARAESLHQVIWILDIFPCFGQIKSRIIIIINV